MKQLVLAALVGVAVACAGLAAESVFAKAINQPGGISQAHSAAQQPHALPPIVVTDGD